MGRFCIKLLGRPATAKPSNAVFSLFSPSCPINTEEKTWTECRLRWLIQELGAERVLNVEVLEPTDDMLPAIDDVSAVDVEELKTRLCKQMQVDAHDVVLEIVEDGASSCSVGWGEPGEASMIRIPQSQLSDPQRLVATLVHGLSREILLSRKLLTGGEPDFSWTMDLLPTFLGLGIFTANTSIAADGAGSHSAKQRHTGYLPIRMHGYALGLFAWLRNELNPSWTRHLRPDASVTMSSALRYLGKTQDSLFDPRRIRSGTRTTAMHELVSDLRHRSRTHRLAALWDLQQQGEAAAAATGEVTECLRDRDPFLRKHAAHALRSFGDDAKSAVPSLTALLRDSSDGVRAAAVHALGVLAEPNEEIIELAGTLLRDPSPDVIVAAGTALRRFGECARPATHDILGAMRTAIIDCNYNRLDVLAAALRSVSADPEADIRDFFGSDPELEEPALLAVTDEPS